MTTSIHPKGTFLTQWIAQSPSVDRVCRKILFHKLAQLADGFLELEDCSGATPEHFSFGNSASDLRAKVTVARSSIYSRTVLGGSIGNAESYIDGDWHADDLTMVVRLFVRNRALLQSLDGGVGKLLLPLQKIMHGLRENTVEGSRENIRAHYDIGNDFFRLFLDETMMYSSGIFETPTDELKVASQRKIDTILRRLRPRAGEHIVEIGTGWGSLAIHAAKYHGLKVTTTTISREQYDYARDRVRAEGLEGKVDVIFGDYRNLRGSFDKLVSVEMIEAVGLDHLDDYFRQCSSLIKDHGLMVLQAITIRDQYYEAAKNSVDFIQRHIFPGGGLPSITAIMNSVTTQTDMVMIEQQDYAEDYAQTLKLWAHALNHRAHEITQLGYPDFLHRLWQYYFSYCEGGFRERAIGVSQLTLGKVRYRDRSFV